MNKLILIRLLTGLSSVAMKTHRIENNWKPVIGSLVHKLVKAGFTLEKVDDGGENIKVANAKEATAAITAVDESRLYVKRDGKRFWLFIVLGNEPEETVADYTVSDDLEAVIDAFADRWDGISVPKAKVPLSPVELAREREDELSGII